MGKENGSTDMTVDGALKVTSFCLNIHLYQSELYNESRIIKETGTLIRNQVVDKCVVLGIHKEGMPECDELEGGRVVFRRIKLITRIERWGRIMRPIYLLEWAFRVLLYCLRSSICILHCHSSLSLPLGVMVKWVKRCKLVYDPHELETEKRGLGGIPKIVAKYLESFFIHWVDSALFVSPSIQDWYLQTYPKILLNKTQVVLNVPNESPIKSRPEKNVLREFLGLEENQILFIYQGALAKGRGIPLMLDAFSRVNRDKHLVFMGAGIMEPLIREFILRHENIHLHGMVPNSEVINYTRGADIGLSLLEDECLNHKYACPNKFFEYILSGLPVIVPELTGLAGIIDQYHCGWKVRHKQESLSGEINRITFSELDKKRQAVLSCQDVFTWIQEQEKLLASYRELFRNKNINEASVLSPA